MTLGFLNIGSQEMILIVIVILLLFGGKKLPELARGLGRGIREFKDASEGIKREISDQINNFEKDLDVTPEEQAKIAEQSAEVKEEEKLTEVVAEGNAKEEKKALPQISTPDHVYQHDPGQQPSTGDQHYQYGYNDHFASEEAADGASVSKTVVEDSTKKV
ncbi:Sec-independent protein translocase subunit TatA/TatB [Sphingobacterium griseoflavum]|uniref:Sec-independent protein translocase protein TatA n=1 Tax=Sphingobacterium griseoflavum TaxID=1474952 RepID=A0ABQ3HPB1_9SPHI|nr:twin-arginine translocase TatA/TatE family subunit [Sphingobacterium griseoflavum]GHE23076.1 hypothetical protein GCM10017764_00440 [Sphingobacterium griseoflavum]